MADRYRGLGMLLPLLLSACSRGPAPLQSTLLSIGGEHTCTIAQLGKLFCWGANDSDKANDGDALAPKELWPGTTWSSVSVSAESTCALQGDASLWCWGK